MTDAYTEWATACLKAKNTPATSDPRHTTGATREAAQELVALANRLGGVACGRCCGAGEYMYSSGATWRGGVGTCSFQDDVCDLCWGTGRTDKKGADLRALEGAVEEAKKQNTVEYLGWRFGTQFSDVAEMLPDIADKLERSRWGRAQRVYGLQEAARCVADVLREVAKTGKGGQGT